MPSVERTRPPTATGTIHRASVACQTCRSRKVKCDAQSAPPGRGCTPCRRAGHECLLDPLSDGRRFVSRKVIDKLQQRIETLEALNQSVLERPAWAPTTSAEETPTRHPSDSTVLISPRTSFSTSGRPSRPETSSVFGTTDSLPAETAATNEASSNITTLPTRTFNTAYTSPPPSTAEMNRPNGASPESSREDPPSYYGATSHPHVVSRASQEPGVMTVFDELDVVGIDIDINSPHLRDNLLQAFFKYQILWVNIVEKETFFSHQALQGIRSHTDNNAQGNFHLGGGDGPQRQPSRWYSKFLESTMLACGARLSTSKAVRALGAKYCDWAKNEILHAMEEPTPANLQGFLLLSEYEVSRGNNRLGWMFCGIACRMLSDLGLHKLANYYGTTPTPNVQDPPSERECSLARDLMSACIVYEGVWTLYLGRPSSIPKSVMSVAAEYYRTYTSSPAMQKTLAPHSRWLIAWLGLCVPMAEISNVLNERSLSDEERTASLRQLFREVEVWYGSLPPGLTYDNDCVAKMDPAAYGLHTQYCKVQILLRRALASLSPQSTGPPPVPPQADSNSRMQGQPEMPAEANGQTYRKRRRSPIGESNSSASDAILQSSPVSVSSTASSVSVPQDNPIYQARSDNTSIYHYAFRTARLVVTYREAFGVEKIPSIMLDNAVVAATAMIGHLNNVAESVGDSDLGGGGSGTGSNNANSADLQRDTIWLRQLLVSIESVQSHFPIIGRMLETLKRICGNGALSTMLYGKPTPSGGYMSSQETTGVHSYARRMSHSTMATNAEIALAQPFGSFFGHQPTPALSMPVCGIQGRQQNMSGIDSVSRFGPHITSYVQDSLLAVGDCPDLRLDCFDSEVDQGFFSSGGLDSLVMDIPMTETLMSNEAPEIL